MPIPYFRRNIVFISKEEKLNLYEEKLEELIISKHNEVDEFYNHLYCLKERFHSKRCNKSKLEIIVSQKVLSRKTFR